ncbi:hypothetical protein Kpol_1005p16 [Vanderwaltozyma polyspora DSM 70294]|uniref:tRNA (guanine(37)-N1)-methyltransferase n=1 Tax=Vanderwaltozyma polyspora (strain ATCC 22028 / DSM 70294 / BCRC 21397 / CBS 2163 / NBRC 10782 / NRRL Y-8283 / UCD 57-17) TaxID=436907 RepID=A7TS42_VANPO|nr:uncharacterized protein Kpol_1005p16 [Vanderwaltozyma polyspora DSM 70294]EDO14928.1 hypothetical protein Kpol_1005p16 [Vanderwaltozyma polyspora DSM 70294]
MNILRNGLIINKHRLSRTMTSVASTFKYQPPVDREMRELDRSFFVTNISLCVVKFPEPKHINTFAKQYRDAILRVPRIPHVVKLDQKLEEPQSTGDNTNKNKKLKTIACDNGIVTKGVLLNDSIKSLEDVNDKLSKEALEFLKETGATILPYEYVMDYNFWKAEEILRSVLPEEFLDEIPTGFTITGHIAHLNLRKEFKPYDTLIGQVILDKNQKIECVVDKVSSIATQFRTFPMKVIAGKTDNLEVEQKESNCTFKFDFSKVYWNSRLHTEHDRLVSKYFKPGEVVCDVFAGVGPFAVPAGKKEVIVLANDLNPESYKYLQENIKLNKVEPIVKPFNLDGAEFIRESINLLRDWRSEDDKILLPIKRKKHEKRIENAKDANSNKFKEIKIPFQVNHYVMNLPDSSIDFLGNFNGILKSSDCSDMGMPWIHIHCFEKYDNDETPTDEEIHKRVYSRILKSMNTTQEILPFENLQFHLVRKVSPTKPMFCVSLQLPEPIARN